MFRNHPAVARLLIALAVLLLVPVVGMLLMMAIGALTGPGMMSHMGGMMGGMGMMSGPMMVSGIVWLGLIAAALVLLIIFAARNISHV
jgi:hypothetical protein